MFFVEILNVIGFANNTMSDITFTPQKRFAQNFANNVGCVNSSPMESTIYDAAGTVCFMSQMGHREGSTSPLKATINSMKYGRLNKYFEVFLP